MMGPLGLGTRDSGLGTRDSGLGTRDSGLGTRDSELGTWDLGPAPQVYLGFYLNAIFRCAYLQYVAHVPRIFGDSKAHF